MYTTFNYRTKKALRDAVATGRNVSVWQPGPFEGRQVTNGEVSVEGPHYPEPHRWYARVTLVNGIIVKVR
jgi:hypothetical protein